MHLPSRVLLTAAAATAVLAAGLLLHDARTARASGESCTAHMAGLHTSRKTPVELVVFNSTGVDMTLDLRLRDADGEIVLDRPGELVVGPFRTMVVSLEAELSEGLAKKEKPFEGLVAVELSGAAPFAADTAIVHATQYFGKTKRPKAAVLFRPLFRLDE